MLASAFENLAPGGWCEAAEFSIWAKEQREDTATNENDLYGVPVLSAPMLQKWQSGLHEAGEKIGRRFTASANLKGWFEEVGYKNVVQIITKVGSLFINLFHKTTSKLGRAVLTYCR